MFLQLFNAYVVVMSAMAMTIVFSRYDFHRAIFFVEFRAETQKRLSYFTTVALGVKTTKTLCL